MLTAILLAGGFGTRVRAIHPDLPKPMIPVAGEPFLEWIIRYWAGQGVERVVVSLGHLAGVAEAWVKTRPPNGMRISTVVENTPLGTGGAVRFAAGATDPDSDPLIVANGDSLVVADTRPALQRLENPELDGVILGVEMEDASRYGTLSTDGNGRLRGFSEKRPGYGLINAGVYILRRRLLARFPAQSPLSMETEVFPALLDGGAYLEAVPVSGAFLDIGTPESLAQAESFVRGNFQ
jgi:D-glycero-alpha-D-manno-heptose 1-phosphate guanylyltransferase